MTKQLAIFNALNYKGVIEDKEPGKHNPVITHIINDAIDSLGLKQSMKRLGDEIAWCSFAAIHSYLITNRKKFLPILKEAGVDGTAISWKRLKDKYGVDLEYVRFGDVAVIKNRLHQDKSDWRRHVAFVAGVFGGKILLYGGNQSNSFSFSYFNINLVEQIIRLE